jgi:glycogen phosphorylase
MRRCGARRAAASTSCCSTRTCRRTASRTARSRTSCTAATRDAHPAGDGARHRRREGAAGAGAAPSVWHMNEGHAAFLGIELIRELTDRGVPFRPRWRPSPRPRVHDAHAGRRRPRRLRPDLLLRTSATSRGAWPRARAFLALGGPRRQPEQAPRRRVQHDAAGAAPARATSTASAGSTAGRLGGRSAATRGPRSRPVDNPVGYVTNGVHVPTFLFQRGDLFDLQYGPGWRTKLSDRQLESASTNCPTRCSGRSASR